MFDALFEGAARMVRRLIGLFNMRHPREGLGWFQTVVAIGDDLPVKSKARVLAGTAWAAMRGGDLEAVARYAGAATEAGEDDPPSVADWLLALVAMGAGNYPQAVQDSRRAIPNTVANRDLTSQAFATGVLAQALAELGDEPEARPLIPEAIGLAERLGNPETLAANYYRVAVALVCMGAPHEAATMFGQGLIHFDMAGPTLACVHRCAYALTVSRPGPGIMGAGYGALRRVRLCCGNRRQGAGAESLKSRSHRHLRRRTRRLLRAGTRLDDSG
jgi:hypothetical protein